MKAIVFYLISGWFAGAWSYNLVGDTNAQIDSTYRSRLDKLAKQLHLRKPELRQGDYQLLVWERTELMYGTAQKLYTLTKRRNRVRSSTYSMQYDKARLKEFRRDLRNKKMSTALWQELILYDVLTLSGIESFLHQRKPPERDTTSRVEMDSNGTVSVIAQKRTGNYVIIGDGVSYTFQVYGKDYYHDYSCANPIEYARAYPDAAELQKVALILYRLFQALHQ